MQSGSLYPGCAIRLEHQPNNPHDSNAIAVKLAASGGMLGHLPREEAPAYAAAIKAGFKFNTTIIEAAYSGDYLEIYIRINWEQPPQIAISPVIQRRASSTFEKKPVPIRKRAVEEEEHNDTGEQLLSIAVESISELAGVYAIENTKTNSYYIGSSQNIRSRLKTHLSDLKAGRHVNSRLQGDYSARTAKYFVAYVINDGLGVEELAEEEKSAIENLRLLGLRLYNLTDDGQGVPPRGDTSISNEPRPVVPGNREPVQPRQEPPRGTPRVDIPASRPNTETSSSTWGWWVVMAVLVGWFWLNSGSQPNTNPISTKPPMATSTLVPTPPPMEQKRAKKQVDPNKDMRHCLNLPTNAAIAECTKRGY